MPPRQLKLSGSTIFKMECTVVKPSLFDILIEARITEPLIRQYSWLLSSSSLHLT
ncbi:hypothetical protein DPMN_169663 [Dreissena polymorpha]|uniref:Uncharacterized protein n=1 Tax=Dreissena polymorpha TaxID=45954 RepID=A0A9D4DVN2_DREPO|nr:hypothetical protein DPMN_169663 [Dreissena polymorpha]